MCQAPPPSNHYVGALAIFLSDRHVLSIMALKLKDAEYSEYAHAVSTKRHSPKSDSCGAHHPRQRKLLCARSSFTSGLLVLTKLSGCSAMGMRRVPSQAMEVLGSGMSPW